MKLRDWLDEARSDARAWCDGRALVPRAALAAYLAYAGVRHMADPLYRSWFAGITLAFHELGHVIFAPLGRTWMLLGGSLTQLAVPAAAALYLLLRQRDWFGLSVGGAWLAFSTWELATYVGDAAREELPLVGLSGAVEHDWSALLTGWRLLNHCDALATALRSLATSVWIASLALAAWLLAGIARAAWARRPGG